MFDFLKENNDFIRRTPVDLGFKTIHIPVADFQIDNPDKTILITAGMDGDEYASIKAAYNLIHFYSKKKLANRIIIIPIVNTPGFKQLVSFNPMDGKFPKHICPGDQNGSPTERLIFWLWSRYIQYSDAWIDLHGGAITETLNPFVWTHETKSAQKNKLLFKIIRTLSAEIIVCEKESIFSKDKFLSQKGPLYFITESGQSGSYHIQDIQRILLVS